MTSQQHAEGCLAFLMDKNCNAIPDNIGDIVCHTWMNHPGIDREWLRGYMDALIEYMQQNDITEI